MTKGVYKRTKQMRINISRGRVGIIGWNKGHTKYEHLINLTLIMIYQSPERPTLGEIFNQLVEAGEIEGTRNGYKRFLWMSQHIDRRLLKDGRGIGNKGNIGEGYGRPAKFQIGDKVRISSGNGRTPLWFRDEIRIDTPRTITSVYKTGRGTLYHVGSNRMGNDLISAYAFRSNELKMFVKAKLGRPKKKRVYNYTPRPEISATSILGVHQALCV